jgi:hypothetical protein
MLKKINFEQIGRKFFDTSKIIKTSAPNITLLPGFQATLQTFDAGVMLNVDTAFKVLRTDTALDVC